MSRMLILIPMMYNERELKEAIGQVPEDFEEASSEFWSYIEEKLEPFIGRVYAVFSTEPASAKDKCVRINVIFKKFEGSAEFLYIDDPLLVAEAKAWLELMKDKKSQAMIDLFEESMRDMNRYAGEVIDKTMRDGGIGILFTDPTRKLTLSEDIKVVKMCPFDPIDYLNRNLLKLKLGEAKNV